MYYNKVYSKILEDFLEGVKMNKKKLIGTIIGVTFFALLIAGATYAWLTYSIQATNNIYNLGSMNFNVNYVNGTTVESVPILSTATTTTAAHLSISANKITGSAPGNLTIYLNTESTTSSDILTSRALHYAVCVTSCTNTSDLSQETNSDVVTATGKLPILSNTPLTSSPTTYIVYFWLDSSAVDENVVGKSYSGYISAEAVQTDTE